MNETTFQINEAGQLVQVTLPPPPPDPIVTVLSHDDVSQILISLNDQITQYNNQFAEAENAVVSATVHRDEIKQTVSGKIADLEAQIKDLTDKQEQVKKAEAKIESTKTI